MRPDAAFIHGDFNYFPQTAADQFNVLDFLEVQFSRHLRIFSFPLAFGKGRVRFNRKIVHLV